MGFLLALLNQPSRSYSTPEPEAAVPAKESGQHERAARKAQYYSAATDPNIRREWDRILQSDSARARATPSLRAGARSTPIFPLRNQAFVLPLAPALEIDEDRFYTPRTSPSTSPRQSADFSSTSPVSNETARPVSSSPRSEKNVALTSVASSATSQASDDEYTNYSWSASGSRSDDTHITIASSTNHSKPSASSPHSDWAKDVRWIIPEESTRHKRAPSRANTMSSQSSTSSRRVGNCRVSSHPRVRRRMSMVREEDGDVEASDYSSAAIQTESSRMVHESGSSGLASPIASHLHASKDQLQPRRWKSVSSARSSVSSASSSASRQTVDVPPLIPHSQSSGYSTLLMPRTVYTPSKHPERVDDFVDLAKMGIVGTTMSTISVTRHGAETISRRARKMSLPHILKPGIGRRSFDLPEHLKGGMPNPVSFSNITPSPTKVQSHQVLVQVWCVALEGLDVLLTRDRAKTADGYGFVPGRGFLGKAMECGSSVSSIRRGDWVMGVLDVGKCGALSEFLVVDRKRLTRSPTSSSLSLEQFAILAVSGFAAHRAVSTVPKQTHGCRVLVLQAHDGVGALVCQELVAGKAKVTAQIPDTPGTLEMAKLLKVSSIKIGEPLQVIESLEEGSFDLVVDTIGGRDIWQACRRLFTQDGQFTTLAGDSPEDVTSVHAHVKSNMRSLYSAFRKSESKHIGYEWVSPSIEVDQQGRDIARTLEEIADLARQGVLKPQCSRIVAFERTPKLLDAHGDSKLLLQGGTAVVRVIE